jgi:hypothetical protein
MSAQLDLEVICKRLKKKGRPFNFHEFWTKEIHYKEGPSPKRKL